MATEVTVIDDGNCLHGVLLEHTLFQQQHVRCHCWLLDDDDDADDDEVAECCGVSTHITATYAADGIVILREMRYCYCLIFVLF